MTSAYLALQIYLGEFEHIVVPFDQIFDAVKGGRRGCGADHPRGPTHLRAALVSRKIIDLGEWWKRETGLPLPLGGNVLRKDIPRDRATRLLAIMRESIDYGLTHRKEAVQHSMPYARDMDSTLASKFIGMYVNEYTRDYGEVGRAAIREFLNAGRRGGFMQKNIELDFVE